jgi:hypothetical protein
MQLVNQIGFYIQGTPPSLIGGKWCSAISWKNPPVSSTLLSRGTSPPPPPPPNPRFLLDVSYLLQSRSIFCGLCVLLYINSTNKTVFYLHIIWPLRHACSKFVHHIEAVWWRKFFISPLQNYGCFLNWFRICDAAVTKSTVMYCRAPNFLHRMGTKYG